MDSNQLREAAQAIYDAATSSGANIEAAPLWIALGEALKAARAESN